MSLSVCLCLSLARSLYLCLSLPAKQDTRHGRWALYDRPVDIGHTTPHTTIPFGGYGKLICNQDSGELIAESGVLIADIIKTFLPKGWFPFVTAGTKFITAGSNTNLINTA